MAKQFRRIEPAHREFIIRQKVFFNATAAAAGRVNVSPRDAASIRVLGPNTLAYLDLTGSGNETAGHLRAYPRLTLMFCAFEGPPMILRLYGHGRIVRRGSAEYSELLASQFDHHEPSGARQMVVFDIDLVQTSCGYGVPQFDYVAERTTLTKWAENRGPEGLQAYWREHNSRTLDGFPTGLLNEGDE